MTDYPPGEGPITHEEAKAAVAADEAAHEDDPEPPAEPLEDALPVPAPDGGRDGRA